MITEWDKIYMRFTEDIAIQSKCAAKKVGCVIVRGTTVLSNGINGTLSGHLNCCDKFVKKDDGWYTYGEEDFMKCDNEEEHHRWSNIHEFHAEMNAIKNATDNGHSVKGSTIYCNYSPCYNCAKLLVLHGINRIVYRNEYDDFENIKKFLELSEVEVIKYGV